VGRVFAPRTEGREFEPPASVQGLEQGWVGPVSV